MFVVFCRISLRILIPVVVLDVVPAILRALLFLWFPEKHGDSARGVVDVREVGSEFLMPHRNRHCFLIQLKNYHREEGDRDEW